MSLKETRVLERVAASTMVERLDAHPRRRLEDLGGRAAELQTALKAEYAAYYARYVADVRDAAASAPGVQQGLIDALGRGDCRPHTQVALCSCRARGR